SMAAGLPRTYSISGRVVNAMESDFTGTLVTLSGSHTATATVDARGNYSFNNLPAGGNYNITPSKVRYSFTPASASFSNLSQNQTIPDFTATAVYSITGRVVDTEGNGVSGVIIALSSAQTRVTQTDSNGNYAFANLPGGLRAYTLSPSTPNDRPLTFTPDYKYFGSLTSDQVVEFRAIDLFKIGGRLVDENSRGM